MLIDFYENDEIDPLVIIREYKTYYSFVEQMEKTDKLFHLTDQEKLTLEYLSKTILSGVRPDELEILRLFLEKNRITYSEVINNCKERYGYEITNQKIDAACDVLKGEFVTNSAERERFCHIDILEADGAGYLKRILSYAERLAIRIFMIRLETLLLLVWQDIRISIQSHIDRSAHLFFMRSTQEEMLVYLWMQVRIYLQPYMECLD